MRTQHLYLQYVIAHEIREENVQAILITGLAKKDVGLNCASASTDNTQLDRSDR